MKTRALRKVSASLNHSNATASEATHTQNKAKVLTAEKKKKAGKKGNKSLALKGVAVRQENHKRGMASLAPGSSTSTQPGCAAGHQLGCLLRQYHGYLFRHTAPNDAQFARL